MTLDKKIIRTAEDLEAVIGPMPQEHKDAIKRTLLPFFTTAYYASLVKKASFDDPVYAQIVPQPAETQSERPDCDPLREERYMPVPGLIRRYKDRAVYTVSSSCASQCRHCTRRWQICAKKGQPWQSTLPGVLEFLKANPEVEEIILSGGDPLSLPDEDIAIVTAEIKRAGIKVLRLGTRYPVTCPQRITRELCEILKSARPLWIQTHFNHPAEITEESAAALRRLSDCGLPVNNQTVLLKGVNDCPETLERLFRLLIASQVRPYYLFQCDRIPGTEHFWTPLEKGLEIIRYLRENLSGIAVPAFIVDRPALQGKVPLSYATVRDGQIEFPD